MPMNYVLQKLDELNKEINSINAWIEKVNKASPHNVARFRELESRLQLLEEKALEDNQESDSSKIVTVKLTCDNSAFLQSLDEIEKKIDVIQNKMNQLTK